MSRRAKLDLSSGKDHHKQQAEGFDTPDLEASTTAAEAQPETMAPETGGYESGELASADPSSPSGVQLVKVLVVVAVTGLILYLLKRRFF